MYLGNTPEITVSIINRSKINKSKLIMSSIASENGKDAIVMCYEKVGEEFKHSTWDFNIDTGFSDGEYFDNMNKAWISFFSRTQKKMPNLEAEQVDLWLSIEKFIVEHGIEKWHEAIREYKAKDKHVAPGN